MYESRVSKRPVEIRFLVCLVVVTNFYEKTIQTDTIQFLLKDGTNYSRIQEFEDS